jgi:tumor protein p53-inducible protein 3
VVVCNSAETFSVLSAGVFEDRDSTKMRAILAISNRASLSQTHPSLQSTVLKEGEILLKVAWSAVNRADTLQRTGKYPPPPGASDILGLEASGIVTAVAPNVTSPAVGDRAMALLSGGGNADFVICQANQTMPVPIGMSLRTAGAIPETWLTAYQLLFIVANAKRGESVVIHAAGSGVGTAAVQLAVSRGLFVIAVAGSDKKLDVVQKLGASAIVNYKTSSDWAAEVKSHTPSGKGVDIILDPVGGSFWKGNSEIACIDARWVLYGSLGGVLVEGPLFGKLMQKRIQLLSTTLRSRSNEYKASLVAAFTRDALPLLASNTLTPVIDREFSIEDTNDAHVYMESNENIGKILIKVSGEE